MREIGTVHEYETGRFEIVENNIIPEHKKTSFVIKLNIWAFVFMAIGVFITLNIIGNESGEVSLSIYSLSADILIICLIFMLFIVVHEWLHGVSFRIWNKNTKKQVKFGLVLKSGMAYCISTVPVKVNAGRISLMMPLYAICIPLYVYGLIQGDIFIGILAIFLASGSVGDIYYMWKLRKTNKDYYMHEEMPTSSGYEVGYILYKKID